MRELYRVWCRYEPDHINMAAGRRGQWRVWDVLPNHFDMDVWNSRDSVSLPSTKQYRIGSIIRPHKELNRVLESRRQHA